MSDNPSQSQPAPAPANQPPAPKPPPPVAPDPQTMIFSKKSSDGVSGKETAAIKIKPQR